MAAQRAVVLTITPHNIPEACVAFELRVGRPFYQPAGAGALALSGIQNFPKRPRYRSRCAGRLLAQRHSHTGRRRASWFVRAMLALPR